MAIIKHNIVELDYLKELNTLLHSTDFPWYYVHTSAHLDDDTSIDYQFSFYHMLVEDEDTERSPYYQDFKLLIDTCIEKSEFKGMKLDRARLGLFTKAAKPQVQIPHVDKFDKPHKSIVFYINESDGPTYIYKQKNRLDKYEKHKHYDVDLISPFRQNSMVCFDGFDFHSSSSPTNHNTRVALNINLV